MGTVSTGIGLFSGINTNDLVNALVTNSTRTIQRLEARAQTFSVKGQGLDLLEATVTALSASVKQLNLDETFGSFSLTNFGSANFSASTNDNAVEATYNFQSIRTASTHEVLSRGFANADQQTIGTGTITIAQGGSLQQETLLDAFNGGNGVQRGIIRITDRSGTSADIDLSDIYTADDVLTAINSNNSIDVTASTVGGKLILTDSTGSTSSDLSVIDLNNTRTAADLGIEGSVSSDTLTGNNVYEITSDFTLNLINDGNGLHLQEGASDIRISLADLTDIDINLDTASTLGDVVNLINNHDDNTGLMTASFENGQFTLIDNTVGGGIFKIEDINDSAVVRQLKLDETAVGSTISGRSVGAGINSVLLENLNGGAGVDTLGEISLTDRSGTSTTIDLSNAVSLDEVLFAINTASDGGTDLQLNATLDEAGTGIVITDTSGSTASNLIIADVAAGTTATDLGIAIDDATNSISSESLNVRYVNEATTLADYAPDGGAVAAGSFLITDSDGNEAIVNVSSSVETIGDVLLRINSAVGIQVTAELNETGDGFVLIDEAGGAGTLTVAESGGTTAADLRILGDGAINVSDGKHHIESQKVTKIDVEATDTLDDVAEKINDIGGYVTANVLNDGSAFNSTRLSLVSKTGGKAGRLMIDDGGLNLGLNSVTSGNDALLRVGEQVSSGFIVSSSTNSFNNVAIGVDITLLSGSDDISKVSVERDNGSIKQLLSGFVSNYNAYQSSVSSLTKFDFEANQRGVLQGEGIVQRVQIRLDSLINRTYLDSTNDVRSLVDLGIRTTTDGKLTFDVARLDNILESNPDAVQNFFRDTTNGFGQIAEDTLDSLTDPFTGTFKTEDNALKSTIASLNGRVEELNLILESKKSRLFIQFAAMEEALARLQSQQSAIAGLSNISFLSPNSRN